MQRSSLQYLYGKGKASAPLDIIVRRLRSKIKKTCGIDLPLKTAHRRGYAFADNIRITDF